MGALDVGIKVSVAEEDIGYREMFLVIRKPHILTAVLATPNTGAQWSIRLPVKGGLQATLDRSCDL